MSRAFVREDAFEDAQAEALRRQRPGAPVPKPMTRRGVAALEAMLAEALAAGDAAMAEALSARLRAAQPVEGGPGPGGTAALGAVVAIDDGSGPRRVVLVGEDETDLVPDGLSWRSPLARALLGAVAGDVVTWVRPAGDLEVDVLSVEAPDGD
ncbi:MAG TPA: GreA/GreB family elongation factor [Azospirillaceae bacterium]|nr:GreA/GreB family elongation factor [Azospirillaceae bacterium]